MTRGFFGIGIFHAKKEENVGTLWRSAYIYGASYIFTIGRRYDEQASDTTKAWRHIPLNHYSDWEDFFTHIPHNARIIGIETEGWPLKSFVHPQEAVYLLGAEDHGLTPEVIARCHKTVSAETPRCISLNVAVAGSIVMYDRYIKNGGYYL